MIRLTFEQREEERRYKARKKAEAQARLLREKVTTGAKLAIADPVQPTTRRGMTPKRLRECWDAAKDEHGRVTCWWCRCPIWATEKWEAEHEKTVWEGGADEPPNLKPMHAAPCHKAKTRQDAKNRAKAKRRTAGHTSQKKAGKPIRSRGFEPGYRPLTGGKRF